MIRAFTLIEIILVIAVLSILGGIAFNIYSNFQWDVKIDEEANRIKYVLRQAQAKAINGENGSSWGLRFFHPASGAQYYELFQGNSYAVGTTTESYFLSGGTEFVNPASGSNIDVVFIKRTGILSGGSAITLTIKTSISDIERNISISLKGLIQ